MRAVAATIAFCGALFGATASAVALEPYDECLQTTIDINTYLRVMQSCSDAAYLREDIGEADALCAAGRALSDRHGEAVLRQVGYAKDPASPNQACAKSSVLPLMGLYVKAQSWDLQFLKVRLDGKASDAPPPLKLIRFAEPE